MTSERQRNAGYLLPNDLPEDTICISMRVPNHSLILAAVRGQLSKLGWSVTWEYNGVGDGRSAEVSLKFRELFQTTYNEGACDDVVNCDELLNCVLPVINSQQQGTMQVNDSEFDHNLFELLGIVDCGSDDKDKVFGAVTQLVDFIDNAISDFFEIIEAATNFVELYGAVLEAIPVVGSVPAGLADFANALQDAVADAYAASFTSELRDTIRCGLFCYAVTHNCQLSWRDIANYFASKTDESLTSLTIDDWLNYVASLSSSLAGDLPAYVAFGVVTHALAWGSEFPGIGNLNRLTAIMLAFFNDPDSDWMTICDECEYCIEYDFTVSDYALDWTPAYVPVTSAVTGLWVDAVGYQHRDYQEDNSNDAYTRAVGLTGLRDWSNATFHKFVVEYTWVYGNSILSNTHAALSSPTGVIKAVTFVNRPANGGVVWTAEEDASPSELRLLVRSSVAQSATYAGSVTVTKIRIYGSGEIPEHGGELC